MESCKKRCREMRVHLVVPGRNQSGSVSIVAGCSADALSALRWVLERIVNGGGGGGGPQQNLNTVTTTEEGNETIQGRIIFDVVNGLEDERVGNFSKLPTEAESWSAHWLFKCSNQDFCILVCKYVEESSESSDNCNINSGGSSSPLSPYALPSLTTCFDNVKFRSGVSTGSTSELECVLAVDEHFVFALGSEEDTNLLYQEIKSVAVHQRNT